VGRRTRPLVAGLIPAAAFACAAGLGPGPIQAQTQFRTESHPWLQVQLPAPPTGANKPADREKLLDALKAAPDEATAAAIEARLRQMWLEAGSPAVTLLMSRGLRAMQSGQPEAAIAAFDDALVLDPDLVAAYHQRALARFRAGDSTGAIRDIQEVLRREPRNFAALRSLSDIAAAREDWKGAYAAWQKLLEVDPETPGGRTRLQDLKRRALGEEA